MGHSPGSVQRVQDAEGFFSTPLYLNLGRKNISSEIEIIWGEIFADETVLAGVAADRPLSQRVFSE